MPIDSASGQALGAFWTTLALDPITVTRSSGRDAYYDSASTRSNLHLLTGNQVTKLVTSVSDSGVVTISGIEVKF